MKNILSDIHDFIRSARTVLGRSVLEVYDDGEKKHKDYPRFPVVQLSRESAPSSLFEAFKKRSAARPADARVPGRQDIGELLHSLRIRDDGHRAHPSGGAKYPIEVYVVGTVGEYRDGVFHYHPEKHALEYLWPLSKVYTKNELFGLTVKEPTSFAIIFTAVWERTSVKYGDFGYQLVLLEAGHIAQNILLTAAALGVGARPFAGYNDEMITDILDLDPGQEQPVYTIQLFA